MSKLHPIAGTKSEGRVIDVVFIHGLDGNHRSTWENSEDPGEAFWPEVLASDIPEAGIWSLEYEAASSKWRGSAMVLLDRAQNALALLETQGIGERPLVFVVHSLGGLVAKQLLRLAIDADPSNKLANATRGVVFFATPHLGSKLADFVKNLGALYRSTALLEDLASGERHLRDLNDWFRDNAARLEMSCLIFRETQATKGISLVVDADSANFGTPGLRAIPVDADHIAICKPLTDDLAYLQVKKFIRDIVTQLGPSEAVLISPQNSLWVDVSIRNEYPEVWEEKQHPKGRNITLSYSLSGGDKELVVRPVCEYLTAAGDTGPLLSIDYMWSPFRWLLPSLDFKLVNNSDSTVYLTSANFRVAESTPVLTCVPVIKDLQFFSFFSITNEGWAEWRNPRLFFRLIQPNEELDFSEPFPFGYLLSDNDGNAETDLTEPLQKLGVKTDSLNGRESLGPFTQGVAVLCGKMMFEEIAGSAPPVDRMIDVAARIRIGNPMFGMFAPPSFNYQIELKTQGKDYALSVPLSQVLQPNTADRFTITMSAAQSSLHRFEIDFSGSNGVVDISKVFSVELFVPRTLANYISRQEAPIDWSARSMDEGE